jgi:hypothetical protein
MGFIDITIQEKDGEKPVHIRYDGPFFAYNVARAFKLFSQKYGIIHIVIPKITIKY